jgi:hypothetical protein
MKKLLALLGCLFLTFAVTSCKSTKPTVNVTETATKTTIEKVHDTIFKTEIDSSSYKALLDCRDGKVVVKEVIQTEPGRILKSPKVRIDNNKLDVDCKAKAEQLFAQWKSTQVNDIQFKTNTITNTINKLTFWQEFQIKGFRILAIILLLLLVWSVLKKRILL